MSTKRLLIVLVIGIGLLIGFSAQGVEESSRATSLKAEGTMALAFSHPENVLTAIRNGEEDIILHVVKVRGCISHLDRLVGGGKYQVRNCGNIEYVRGLKKNDSGYYNLTQNDYEIDGKRTNVFNSEEPTTIKFGANWTAADTTFL